ncbi:DUF935 family protein, partial [Pseudomonas carnis]
SSIEIKEASGKAGSATVYRELLEYCRSEINVAMLGQNQTTEKESNRASAEAGAEVTDDIRDGDAGIVATAINAVIRRIVDINFGENVVAPVYELWEQQEIDKVLAERDKSLSESGVKFTPQYFKRTYNLQDGDIVETAPGDAVPAFAEPTLKLILDQVALDQAIDSLSAEQLQEQSEKLVAPVLEALQRGRSDSEALGLLAEVYPQMDDQSLQQELARLLFIANIWGRLSASADRED